MSVQQIDTIDYVYVEEQSEAPVLVVSDPLGWTAAEEGAHIEMLTEKLQTQMAFVATGQIAEVWPAFHEGEPVWVEVAGRCALSRRAEDFYEHARQVMANDNMKLRFMLLS